MPISLSEAKILLALWSKGTFPTVAESIRYHFARHGKSILAKNVWQYLRKSAKFANSLRNARKKYLDDGKIRYMKNGFFAIIDLDGKIVSFGFIDE